MRRLGLILLTALVAAAVAASLRRSAWPGSTPRAAQPFRAAAPDADVATVVFDATSLVRPSPTPSWWIGRLSRSEHGLRDARRRWVVDKILADAAPGSWRANGGSNGAIAEIYGQLVVTNTPRNLAAVEDLLWRLKARSLAAELLAWAALAGVAATPFAMWRPVRRRRAGHCHACGYDLRASPGRCPECGAGA